ncbi:MAG: phospho-N-acetylmuramoyl-pentapeptide-transferase [Negativicutes bacterium]|jgi:phospho-N-acetylmuramoyl-pentapeptide-transferase
MFYSLIAAFLVSLLIALACGPLYIPLLRRLKAGQAIREEGPQSHYKKAGTPTMGGVIFLTGILATTILFAYDSAEAWLALAVTFGHAGLGFADDFIKVVLKRNLGLRAREKFIGQIVMTIIIAVVSQVVFHRGTDLWIPVVDAVINIGWLYYVLIFFVLVGTTNAVNLTDGLDGLAAGATVVSAAAMAIIAVLFNHQALGIFAATVSGGCLGFLKYNKHKAQVFMGDTGSLALGAALAMVALLTKTELLFLIIGGVYVAEALSVMIQVAYFKHTGGKRIFRMSPLHHHFELGGWNETKVTFVFWSCGVLCAAIALMLVLI